MTAHVPSAAAGSAVPSRSLALRAIGVLVVSAGAAAAVSGLLIAGGGPGAWTGRAPTEVTAVPAAEAASFSILRRAHRVADGFVTLHAGSGPAGANPAFARTVTEPTGGLSAGTVSVVPAAGAVCLRVPFAGGGAFWECQPLALARAGKLIAAVRPAGPLRNGGRQLLVGLVPDGVRGVTVTVAGGARVRLSVRSNVYDAQLLAPRSVGIEIPGGGTRRYAAP